MIFMLHIVNGEATLPRLEAAKIGGHLLSWFDMLMEGPLVDGLRSDSSWEFRACYLARKFGIPLRATSKPGEKYTGISRPPQSMKRSCSGLRALVTT